MSPLQSKKAISPIISYVLLVVISIVLSVLVYNFMKLNIPQEVAECNPDIALIISEATCDFENKVLTVTLKNKGLFNIDGAYIRFGEQGRTVKKQLNEDDETFRPGGLSAGPLKPGETVRFSFDITDNLVPLFYDYILEVQAAMNQEERILPCEGKIVSSNLKCTPSGGSTLEDYFCTGNWQADHPCNAVIDRNDESYGASEEGESSINMNYTKPTNAQHPSHFKLKWGTNDVEYLIPENCFNQNPVSIKLNSIKDTGILLSCYNGFIDYQTIISYPGSYDIYEASPIWNTTSSEPECGDSDGICPVGCTNPPDVDCPISSTCAPGHISIAGGLCLATISNIIEDGDVQMSDFSGSGTIGPNGKTTSLTGIRITDTNTLPATWGYVQWDISEIPDDSSISDVSFKYFGTSVTGNEGIYKLILSKSATLATATEMYSAFLSEFSNPYRNIGVGGFASLNENTMNLGTDAISDLDSELNENLFGLAFMTRTIPSGGSAIISSSESTNTVPTLLVEYAPCGDGVCVSGVETEENCLTDCGGAQSPCESGHTYNSGNHLCTAEITKVNEDGDITDTTTRVKNNDYLRMTKAGSSPRYMSYIEWDISEIPSATVMDVSLEYYGLLQNSPLGPSESIRSLTDLSESLTGVIGDLIYTTGLSGDPYYGAGNSFVTLGEDTIFLNSVSTTDINSQLSNNQNWFAIAMWAEGPNAEEAQISSSEDGNNPSPKLIVKYAPCGDDFCAAVEDSSSCPEDCS